MKSDDPTVITLFIGWGQGDGFPDYSELTSRLAERDYEAAYPPITWFGPAPEWTPTLYQDWLDQVRLLCMRSYHGCRRIYAGFSVGAIIALAMSAEFSPDELWLLSPSAWVPEAMQLDGIADLSMPSADVLDSLSAVNVRAMAQTIACPVKVAVGLEERPVMIAWAANVAGLLEATDYFQICGADHNPLRQPYLEFIVTEMATRQ
ncbi:MAG TPA: hypothetical protein VMS08_05245 [Candidatus Saccharimonadia bacterium]|nr:hypothetical protein [Candidatus Saccharimonadia bacterium]